MNEVKTQEPTLFTPTTKQKPESRKPSESDKRIELTLTLSSPTDLKVAEGDAIAKGQILVERQPTEAQLYQRSRLINQINSPKPLPEQVQLVAAQGDLRSAQFMLEDLPNTSRIIDQRMRETSKYLEKQGELKSKVMEKQAEVEMLKSMVENAKITAEVERSDIGDQLKVVDAEIERLKVRSPYSGTIRRLKINRGRNTELTAKLVIQTGDASR